MSDLYRVSSCALKLKGEAAGFESVTIKGPSRILSLRGGSVSPGKDPWRSVFTMDELMADLAAFAEFHSGSDWTGCVALAPEAEGEPVRVRIRGGNPEVVEPGERRAKVVVALASPWAVISYVIAISAILAGVCTLALYKVSAFLSDFMGFMPTPVGERNAALVVLFLIFWVSFSSNIFCHTTSQEGARP